MPNLLKYYPKPTYLIVGSFGPLGPYAPHINSDVGFAVQASCKVFDLPDSKTPRCTNLTVWAFPNLPRCRRRPRLHTSCLLGDKLWSETCRNPASCNMTRAYLVFREGPKLLKVASSPSGWTFLSLQSGACQRKISLAVVKTLTS